MRTSGLVLAMLSSFSILLWISRWPFIPSESVPLVASLSTTPTIQPSPPPPPYQEIGDAYLNANRADLAAQYYIKALENGKDNPDLLLKLKLALGELSLDPRMEIADKLFEQKRYDEALQLYTRILEQNPAIGNSKQKAIDAVSMSSNGWSKAFNDLWDSNLPKTVTDTASTIGGILIWGLFLGLIYTGAKGIQRYRTNRLYKNPERVLDYVILPFINGTTEENMDGVGNAVRAQVADFLYKAKAYVELREQGINLSRVELPDLGSKGINLLNWVSLLIRPDLKRKLISAILIGKTELVDGEDELVIGLSVGIKNSRKDSMENLHVFWKPISSNSDYTQTLSGYLALAKQGAAWVLNPSVIPTAEEAERSYQANILALQAKVYEKKRNKDKAKSLIAKTLDLLRKPSSNSGRESYGFSQEDYESEILSTSLEQSELINEQIYLFDKYRETLESE